MKEKISCSLDGNVIEKMDDLISDYPVIGSRSALIDIAIMDFYNHMYNAYDDYSYNDYANTKIIKLLERRFTNGQKESEK